KFPIAQMCGPHDRAVPFAQATLNDLPAVVMGGSQHLEQFSMAGLRHIAIRNHKIAERVEHPVGSPLQGQTAAAAYPSQIADQRPAFVSQEEEKDQRRNQSNWRMQPLRQARNDRENGFVGKRCVVSVLVPAGHLRSEASGIRLASAPSSSSSLRPLPPASQHPSRPWDRIYR